MILKCKEDDYMKTANLQLETLTCPSCLQKIESAVKGITGVDGETVKVRFNASRVKADFDSEQTSVDEISQAIENLGYEVLKARAR